MTRQAMTEDDLNMLYRNMGKVGGGAVGKHTQRSGGLPAFKASVGSKPRQMICRTNAAGSNPAPSPFAPYRSKWESAYANKLELEKQANLICNYWYEPFSLWLPGKVRYRPDFMIQYYPTGHTPNRPGFVTTLEIVEVKGWSKNRRDGITRLKIAAALFPCFVWRMVWMKKGGGFDGEYI